MYFAIFVGLSSLLAVGLELLNGSLVLGAPPWLSIVIAWILTVPFIRLVEVPEDERWAIELFGAYNRTLNPGLNLMIRWIEQVSRDGKGIRSTREFVRPIEVQGTFTLENIRIETIKTQLRNRMKTDKEDREFDLDGKGPVYKNTYALGSSIDIALRGRVDSVVRNIVGKYNFDYIRNHVEEIQNEIAEGMTPTLNEWGEKFLQLDIMEIIPNEEIRQLLEAPFQAEKEGAAGVITADNLGKAAEAKAKGDAQATRLAADAKKYAVTTDAEGVAQALDREATSKTAAIRALAKAYGYTEDKPADDPVNIRALQEATNYLLAEEGFATMAKLGSNGGTVIIPAGTEGIGALVGMVKGLMTKSDSGTTSPDKVM